MFERLGSASVRNYLSDDEVRNDFNRAFGAVRKYLGQPSEETWASAQPVSNPAAKTATQEERLLLEQSTSEDTWTSLARARRDLETALGAALDLPADDRRRSAGQMVMLAEKRQLLTSDQTTRLREAVNIANHAIHGETVSPEAAADAVVRISALLQKLEAGATPDLLPPTPQPAARRVDVVPGEGDHWRVISGRAGVTKVYGTQREAIDGARDLIYKSGGGEVAIHGRDGRIQARDTVASSRAEKDAARN
jgi:hypothetical protein